MGRFKHGFAPADQQRRSREYRAWKGMRQRCLDPNRDHADRYIGRGIKLCAAWDDFATFLADLGPCPGPGYSIERLDNDGNYEPGNCRWATKREQSANRSDNKPITFRGVTLHQAEWARRAGVSPQTFWKRLHRGWGMAKAVDGP